METINVISPIDNSLIGRIRVDTKENIDRIVEKALTVKPLPLSLRSEILLRTAQEILNKKDELVEIIHREQGKSLNEAEIEVFYTSKIFKATASALSGYKGNIIESILEPEEKIIIERYEHMGVVAIIMPFNFPLLLPAYLIAPAIAAGNSVIFKPSELCPFSGIKLVEILNSIEIEDEFLGKATLPQNSLSIVTGDGRTGKALVENKDISMIALTGSIETGRKIIKDISKNLDKNEQPKKLLLELGGNSPVIVFDDADIERAVEKSAYGAFTYCGEVCISTQRIYVQSSIYKEFLKKLIKEKRKHKPGPIRTMKFLDRILGIIDNARKNGARIYGAKTKGLYLEPTIIEMNHKMSISKEEIFAPVVGIMPFNTEEEAIRFANSTPHGLSAAVFTRDLKKSIRVAEKIKSGTVVINDTNQWFEPHIAFGGHKWSGMGIEGGIHAIREFSRIKTIVLDVS